MGSLYEALRPAKGRGRREVYMDTETPPPGLFAIEEAGRRGAPRLSGLLLFLVLLGLEVLD